MFSYNRRILLRMKNLITFILVLPGIFGEMQAQELGDLRWQHRILLLMDPNGNPPCDQQLKMIKGRTAEFQERDLLVFVFDGSSLLDENGKKSPIGTKEVPNPTFEGVILIGKDGSVKLQKPFLLDVEEIFRRIDSMPMRKSEMRDGNKG